MSDLESMPDASLVARWTTHIKAGLGVPDACLARAERLTLLGAQERATPLLIKAAKAGIADAQARLGQAYLQGVGILPNMGQALRWLHAAADQGNTDAHAQLAELALQGVTDAAYVGIFADISADQAVQWEQAERHARIAAVGGSVQAKSLLAFILMDGPEGGRNEVEAEALYRDAAALGWARAQLGLALMLLRRGNAAAARAMLLRAAADDLPLANYWLGTLAESGLGQDADPADSAVRYRRAAEAGCVPAQTRLGLALLTGRGIAQDHFNAETWLRRAAIGGDVQAAVILGLMASDAQDQPPNMVDAIAWLERAAEAGHAGAARSLGQFHRMGKGVPRDNLEAARWFRAAVAAGDTGAWADRFSMVLAGHAEAEERNQVIRWLLAEAKAGDAGALFKLGLCRAHGAQGRVNTALARFYFLTAARDGLADAAAAAGEMLVNGRGGPADLPHGVALLRQAAQDGHAGANYALGVLLSETDALHRAADAGHPGARIRLEELAPA
jgi:uncharacterized protein